jgi:hypothetical protein
MVEKPTYREALSLFCSGSNNGVVKYTNKGGGHVRNYIRVKDFEPKLS